MSSKRIVIATYGSLGDIHPALAIALELQARGYQVIFATSEFYRTKITRAGVAFFPLRPDVAMDDSQAMQRAMDAYKGPEVILREVLLPELRHTYEDLLAAVDGADLLVSSDMIFAAPIIAQKTGISWISYVVAPLGFFSAYDVPVLPPFPWLVKLRRFGPLVNASVFKFLKLYTQSWTLPIRQLRQELGLPSDKNPLYEGKHSPELVLALFSSVMGTSQPDWPPKTKITGFPFYDRQEHQVGLLPELAEFLDNGPPPLVFTLGSAAVNIAGDFYTQSVLAAQQLGYRAILLVGKNPENLPPQPLLKEMIAVEYAPYSEIFGLAAAIVHQGGIGTTAQALRSGVPMLVMPFSIDQPDNAARIVRLGVGRTIKREQYTAKRVAAELGKLLNDPSYKEKAKQVSQRVQAEDGVCNACDAIENHLKVITVA